MRDRSRLLLTVFLISAPAAVAAQQPQIGFKAGASLATLERDRAQPGEDPYERRTGITAGPFLLLPLANRFALQLEMLFTEKGGSVPLRDPVIVVGSATTRFKFHYMDVPVLAQVRGPRINSASLHAFAGPTVSVRVSASQQTVFSGEGAFGFQRDLEEMKRLDFGFTVGAGAEIQRMFVDARYTRGLDEVVTDLAGARLSNRAFLITAGFRIF